MFSLADTKSFKSRFKTFLIRIKNYNIIYNKYLNSILNFNLNEIKILLFVYLHNYDHQPFGSRYEIFNLRFMISNLIFEYQIKLIVKKNF